MDYLNEIVIWVDEFTKTVCGGMQYTHEEVQNITDLYINLRSRYKKETIDTITKDNLLNNSQIINKFKSSKIASTEINDMFDFFVEQEKILNSKDFKDALADSIFDSNKIKDFKVRKIQEIGVLDFVEFKKHFKSDVAFCDIKEALGWCLAYIESGDYDIKDIIAYKDGSTIDKESTFKNIIKEINNKSLTNLPPFSIEGDKITFVPAGSSEIDVKLWNESEQKFIGMSATRDRTNLIEGNQFIRHSMQVYAWSAIFDMYKSRSQLPSEFKLSTGDIRKIMHDYGWQNKLRDKNILKIKNLDNSVIHTIEDYHLEFGRHLSFVREYIKNKSGISFHKNGTHITEEEVSKIAEIFKGKSKFYFFGEILEKADVPEINAGLIKRSYLANFKNIMDFEMDSKATKKFLDSIDIRFNKVDAVENIDKYSEFTVFSLLTKSNAEFSPIASIFSEGKAYKEERGMLYKNVSVFFEDIIKYDCIDDTIKMHFNTLSETNKKELKISIENGEVFNNLKNNYKLIKKAPSEVNQFSENMFSLSSGLENHLNYLDEKNKNKSMLEYLKSQGIGIDLNDLKKFQIENKDKKECNILNKKPTN